MSQRSKERLSQVPVIVGLAMALGMVVFFLPACQFGLFASKPTSTPTKTPRSTATHTPTSTATLVPSPTEPSAPTETPAPTMPAESPTPTETETPMPGPPTNTPGPPTPTTPPTPTSTPRPSCPPRPEPRILDVEGRPQDWNWLEQRFNLTREELISHAPNCPNGVVYAVVEVREYQDTTYRVTVLDRNGARRPGVPVAFFGFPTDEPTPGECRQSASIRMTKENGEADYSTGGGDSYYPSQGQKGYHAMWVRDGSIPSDCAQYISMAVRLYHGHLTVTFREISR
jgi:hypothetical protein